MLEAIYAAYGAGWDGHDGAEERTGRLVEEALFLGRLVVELLPEEPEPKGLLALMLHCEARRPARRGADGEYVPLNAQDPALWVTPMIAEAEVLLTRAAAAGRFGRFQTEAAIQSVHAEAPRRGGADTTALVVLYNLLVDRHPTMGALVGRAVAQAAHFGAARGHALLDAIAPDAAKRYQPYWAARLHLAREAGDGAGAEAARARAIALCRDPAVIRYLERA